MALYDIEGGMLGMGQTAVRAGNGSYTVKLPVKAPERFTAKAFLLDANSAPLCECYVLDRSGQYSITGLTVADGQAAASVSAGADCQLMLRFLSDDGQDDLGTLYAPVESGAETVTADLPQDLSLPANFRVEAALKNSGGQTLGEPYLCLRYTSAYQKTAEDYPKEQVLDFGEEGFAVLKEGVKRAGAATETAGGYSVDMPILPAVGDVVALTIDGATVPVKVGSASMAGGKTVIVPDENATLADLYDVLRVDGTIDIKPDGAEQSVQLYSGDDLGDKKRGLPLLANGSVTIVPNLSLTFEGQMALKYQLFYDKAMDPDYFEKELVVEGQGTITLANGAEAGTDNKTGGVEVTVMESPGIALGTTGLEADLKLSIPLSFSVGAGDTVIWEYDLCEGVGYQAGLGHRWVSRSKNVVKNTAQKAGCSASIGFQGSLEVGSVGGLIPLKASLGLQSGVRYDMEVIASTTGSERHACGLCFDHKITAFQELNASIACELGYLVIPLAKFSLPLVKEVVMHRYHSLVNDVDSLFGGQPATGEGECPNKQYLITVNARDLSNNEVKNASLTVKRKDTGKVMAEGASPGACWLYNGKYTASAVINGCTFEKDFTVSNAPQTVDIKETKTTLRVTVTDKDTSSPLSGVRVSCTDITDPGSQPQVGDETTNKNGLCFFRVNPGQYTLAITAEDYDNTTRQVAVANEDEIPVDIELPRTEAYAGLTVYLIDKTTRQPVAGNITLSVTGPTVPLASASNGVAEMKHLIPGDYTVTVPATGGYAPASKTITLAPGQEGALTIELLGETGTLTGTVKNSGSKTIFGAMVTATNEDGDAISTTTDLNGAYTLTLAPGSYTVKASASGYASQSATASVVKDQTATQNFTLKATEGEGWSFDEATGTLTISGSGPMTKYSQYSPSWTPWYGLRTDITSVILEEGITSIGDYAFGGYTNLTSISIPNGVTSIGAHALSGCAITGLTIPNSVTSIGDYAFYVCKLASIDIPSSVTSIGNNAFEYCQYLTSVTIPGSVTSIGNNAFDHCSALTSVDIPSGVTSIGSEAFLECEKLASVDIQNGVKTIGARAFRNCGSLTSVEIPGSVASIGSSVFEGCISLVRADIQSGVASIANRMFYNCARLASVAIPDSVTLIGEGAFMDCSALGSIDIPGSVTSIGADTFLRCKSLTSITIPSGVTSIENFTFAYCVSLTSITIPNSVTSIGTYAFQNCSGLTSIDIPSSVISIGDHAFFESGLTSLTIPNSVTSIGGSAFSNCSSLSSITIPDSVTSIGNYAFMGCHSLPRLTIPSGVTSIGEGMFENCSKLTSLAILGNVTSIGDSAFYGCSNLSSLTIPDSVTSIGGSAFFCCKSLTSVTIPTQVTSIGHHAFYYCENLTSITIPGSVTSIGNFAFADCSGLTSISISSGVTSIGSSAFSSCTNLATVYYGGTQDQWDALKVSLPASATVICTG